MFYGATYGIKQPTLFIHNLPFLSLVSVQVFEPVFMFIVLTFADTKSPLGVFTNENRNENKKQKTKYRLFP